MTKEEIIGMAGVMISIMAMLYLIVLNGMKQYQIALYVVGILAVGFALMLIAFVMAAGKKEQWI
jgi:hypothetical protein